MSSRPTSRIRPPKSKGAHQQDKSDNDSITPSQSVSQQIGESVAGEDDNEEVQGMDLDLELPMIVGGGGGGGGGGVVGSGNIDGNGNGKRDGVQDDKLVNGAGAGKARQGSTKSKTKKKKKRKIVYAEESIQQLDINKWIKSTEPIVSISTLDHLFDDIPPSPEVNIDERIQSIPIVSSSKAILAVPNPALKSDLTPQGSFPTWTRPGAKGNKYYTHMREKTGGGLRGGEGNPGSPSTDLKAGLRSGKGGGGGGNPAERSGRVKFMEVGKDINEVGNRGRLGKDKLEEQRSTDEKDNSSPSLSPPPSLPIKINTDPKPKPIDLNTKRKRRSQTQIDSAPEVSPESSLSSVPEDFGLMVNGGPGTVALDIDINNNIEKETTKIVTESELTTEPSDDNNDDDEQGDEDGMEVDHDDSRSTEGGGQFKGNKRPGDDEEYKPVAKRVRLNSSEKVTTDKQTDKVRGGEDNDKKRLGGKLRVKTGRVVKKIGVVENGNGNGNGIGMSTRSGGSQPNDVEVKEKIWTSSELQIIFDKTYTPIADPDWKYIASQFPGSSEASVKLAFEEKVKIKARNLFGK